MTVEVIRVSQEARTVVVRQMPQSQRELIDAVLQFFTDNELSFSVTEVLRYERPQHMFYAVRWVEGAKE